jgi:hypothetical protein
LISAFKAQRPTVERPRKMETSVGIEPTCTALQAATWPLGHDVGCWGRNALPEAGFAASTAGTLEERQHVHFGLEGTPADANVSIVARRVVLS